MATAAAFNTYELLENIIVHLPAADILQAKKVCKTWRSLMRDSTRLQHACVVAPPTPFPDTYTAGGPYSDSVPVYPESASLRLHPCFKATQKIVHGTWVTTFMVDPNLKRGELYRAANNYLTSPPCQTIRLVKPCPWTVCNVYVTTGIRIIDMVEVSVAMNKSLAFPSGHGLFQGQIVGCNLVGPAATEGVQSS